MNLLNRRVALRELLRERGDLIVVAGLGAPAYDLAACGDRSLDFPLWGAMGGAVMVGLGLALSQPRHNVLVVTGDGEMLMGMSSIATVSTVDPPNLRIVVMDNECYGETGGQPTHTAAGTDLAAVARGCGITNTSTLRQLEEVTALRQEIHTYSGVIFAVLKVSQDAVPRILPPRDGAYLSHRLRAALLGEDAAAQE